MKVFAVDSVYNFIGRQGLSTDHRDLFHGMVSTSDERPDFPDPGEAPGVPLNLMRSGYWKPDVFEPAHLVVCEAVRAKLSWVPYIEFRQVRFVKLFDFPYYAPGDFTYKDNPVYKKAVGRNGHADRLFTRLPDVPELHRDFPPYYEMIVPKRTVVGASYGGLKKIVVPMPAGSGGRKEVTLSEEILVDYPVLGWSYLLVGETVFPLIAPHLDRNYFDVVEVEV